MAVEAVVDVSVEEYQLKKGSLYRKLPALSFVLGLGCLAVWGFFYGGNEERALFSYLFAYVSVLTISLGGMIFVLIQHVTRAGWSVSVRRIAECMMAAVPLFILLFIPIALKSDILFSWAHISPSDKVLLGKEPYLNLDFFWVRSAGYLLIWTLIGTWFYRVSVSQDGGRKTNDTRKLWAASAAAIVVFALTVSFASFDWLMSLQPHWFSTIFGVYTFAGAMLSGLALITLICMSLQSAGYLKHAVNGEHYHDLGKLLFGFTVFWAYIAFSQFMLYWYANIPEEVEFFIHRLGHGWEYLSWALPVTNFFIPFFVLMSRHVKRNKPILGFMCVWVLLTHFMDIYWLVMPNYGMHGDKAVNAGHLHFSAVDLFSLVGIFSLFFGCVSFLLTKRDLIPTGDPRLVESLAFENF